jgi:hypothetical protein
VGIANELKERVQFSLDKVKIAQRLLRYLVKIPWVQMIFLTGSVASLNAQAQDDIDVWLVVDPKRIWITRALDFFLYAFSGKRRLSLDGSEAARINNKLCFNFYSTSASYSLQNQTVSAAIQFVDAVPLFVRDFRQYKNLLAENRWIEQFFPSWYRRELGYTAEIVAYSPSKTSKSSVFGSVIDVLDYVAGVLMLLKAEKRLVFAPAKIFCPVFTTWGTPRILSTYDHETLAQSGKENE